MGIVVVGSLAYDTVITPKARVERVLGGSCAYFALAANYFTDVQLVAVIGSDFKKEHFELFRSRGIDLDGVQISEGKTFFWEGEYEWDMNIRRTRKTELNVFETFQPSIPEKYRKTAFLFLANINPELQQKVMEQMENPQLVGMDTMDIWIENKNEALKEVLKSVHLLIINDSEARQLGDDIHLNLAAKKIREMGPKVLIVKRGEFGAMMFSEEGPFWVPALPLDNVVDPTGAGDTFAGGVMGYLAMKGDISPRSIREALFYGTVMASFAVEDFSVNRLLNLKYSEIELRKQALSSLCQL